MGDDKVMFLVDCGLLSHCRKVGVRAASVLLLICSFVCLSVANALLSAIGRLVCLVIRHWLTGVPSCPPLADWCSSALVLAPVTCHIVTPMSYMFPPLGKTTVAMKFMLTAGAYS